MILFNFISIKSGGGQQNALSFLENIKLENEKLSFVVSCTEDTLIHEYCIKNNLFFFSVKNTLIDRIKFEFFGLKNIRKHYPIKIIFTIFGAAPFCSYKATKISGCAYSNIFQPEIDIWGYLPWKDKILKKIIDIFRVVLVLKSDHIILETPFLKERARKGILKNKKISVIEMAPSKLITDRLSNIKEVELHNNFYDILYLSGAQPNKRIDKFLDLIPYLNRLGSKKFRLKLTLPEDSSYFKEVIKPKIDELKIREYVINLGTIHPEKVVDIISDVDAIVNVALIESFSNNWVEAWAARRLLIATDADWARASCKDAALYIDIYKPLKAAELIHSTFINVEDYMKYITAGEKLLEQLPSSNERTQQYLNIIKSELEK